MYAKGQGIGDRGYGGTSGRPGEAVEANTRRLVKNIRPS